MFFLNSRIFTLFRFGIFFILPIFFTELPAFARSTDLDLTFGRAGFVRTIFDRADELNAASALQADGKIVVAGSSSTQIGYEFSVARFNPDGSRDLSFANEGYVNTPFRKGDGDLEALAIQPDGKIVVVGVVRYVSEGPPYYTKYDIAAARYNPDGSLDASFGVEGKLSLTADTENSFAYKLAIQEDGKLLILGATAPVSGSPWNFAVFRLDPSGLPDNTFGSGGISLLGNNASFRQIAVQPDGKILVSGTQSNGKTSRFAAARLNTDGTYDQSFGNAGLATSSISSGIDTATSLLMQPDGKILVGGFASQPSGSRAVVRFNADGSMDPAFDGDGYALISAPAGDPNFVALALQPDGNIVIASASATIPSPSDTDILVERLTTSGQLDPTFGNNGHVIRPIGPLSDQSKSVSIDENGSILVSASTVLPPVNTALLRLNSDGSMDNSFGISGVVVTNSSDALSYPFAVRFQSSGKIVVAGNRHISTANTVSKPAVARYNDDGSPDGTFNGAGDLPAGTGTYLDGHDMKVQPDDKMVVVGSILKNGHVSLSLIRYTSDGSLDSSFDGDGVATADLGAGNSFGIAVSVQADGKIVAAGRTTSASSDQTLQVGLVRFNSDGSLDTTFGVNGKALTTVPGGGSPSLSAITQQQDGKFLVCGTAGGAGGGILLIRYNTDGSLDATFNGNGIVTAPSSQSFDSASDLKVQTDGKIVVAGAATYIGGSEFVMLRYDADGSPDYTFYGSGRAATRINSLESHVTSLTIQPDGKYIVAGYRTASQPRFFSKETRQNHTVIVRFQSNGMLDRFNWGNRGILGFDFDGGDALDHVAIDGSGRMILAGYIDNNFAVARLLGDGASLSSMASMHK